MLQDRLHNTYGTSVQFCAVDDPTRVSDGVRVAIHHRKSSIPSHECLRYAAIDILVLSKCAFVLKSPSALSCFAKIMEPKLPLRLMNGFTQYWFPDAADSHTARIAFGQTSRNRAEPTKLAAFDRLSRRKKMEGGKGLIDASCGRPVVYL